jgi:short subunit dehydrogenase-like uncharacterized protein
MLGESVASRQEGKIVREPIGKKGMWVDFVPKDSPKESLVTFGGEKKLFVMSIPWGDISTAYFTTGIPNIETYTGVKPIMYKIMKMQGLFNGLLKTEWIKNIIRKKIRNRPAGPSDEERSKAKALVWGEALNATGVKMEDHFTCADGYTLTAFSTLIIAKKVLEGNFKHGYQTPAACYGKELVKEIPHTSSNF